MVLIRYTLPCHDDHCAMLFSNPTMQDEVMDRARFWNAQTKQIYTHRHTHIHTDRDNSIFSWRGRKMVSNGFEDLKFIIEDPVPNTPTMAGARNLVLCYILRKDSFHSDF